MIDKQFILYAALAPGLVTVGIARLTSSLPGLDGIELGIFLFLASIINTGISVLLMHVYLRIRVISLPLNDVFRHTLFWTLLISFSCINGLLLASAYENAWINKLVGQKFGLSKTAPHTALHDLLRHTNNSNEFVDNREVSRRWLPGEMWEPVRKRKIKKDRILKIGLKSAESVFSGYSGSWSSKQIYLSPACRHYKNITIPISGPGIFIPLDEISWIEFIDEQAGECARTQRYEITHEALIWDNR